MEKKKSLARSSILICKQFLLGEEKLSRMFMTIASEDRKKTVARLKEKIQHDGFIPAV